MRPRDFPDFFSREPPFGQSRESRIRLDARGRFWDGDSPVLHERMREVFARWLSRHPESGRYILENGYDWLYLEVEDTPCFVTAVRGSPPHLRLVLLDGSEEEVPHEGWRVREDGSVTVLVRDAAFEARLLPHALSSLTPWLDERGDRFGLDLGTRFVSFRAPHEDVELRSE